MRLPRDWSGEELIKRLKKLGYEATRQSGSHVRLTRRVAGSEHHVTIPLHKPIRIGTLNHVLNDVAKHLKIDRENLLEKLL